MMVLTAEYGAYLALLAIPHGSAVRATLAVQSAMATLRDHIADMEGREPESVQDEAEALSRSVLEYVALSGEIH